jgi:uncharacterized circularly permuted ATP-grasp superfamily protein
MPSGLIDAYPFSTDRYDEMLCGPGAPRPHWNAFVQRIEGLSSQAMRQRAGFVADAIAADGVTYNVYADPEGMRRPWELDMLPLVISAAEWRRLSAAVAQRAEVLDRVLADLYGPQRLLIEGLLPPALVFGQHGYQWPCHGIAPAGGRHLHFYAVDLARAPDGSWWVIADRTQGPSGAATRCRTASSCRRPFQTPSETCACTSWRASSAPCRTAWHAWPPPTAKRRCAYC